MTQASLLTATAASAAAAALAMAVASAATVSQVHLGLSSSAVGCTDGIAVSFASDTAAAITVTGTSSAGTVSVESTWTSYNVSEPKYNYTYASPMLHTALLCDLAENTQYAYSIGDSAFSGSFLTPPKAGSDVVETILGVVGDPGDTTYSETTLAELSKPFEGKHIQALVIAGDYSYANGEHRQWDNWMSEQQNLTSVYPMTGINGNHETISSSGHLNLPPYPADTTLEAENYLGYITRVYTPISDESKAALHTWFSLDIGLVHCVFIDDYTGSNGTNTAVVGTDAWLADREAQLEWVQADLSSVDRSVTPWVIVFKHNPYYNTWSNHQCQCSSTVFDIDEADADNCWKGAYNSKSSGTAYKEPHCGLQAKLEEVYSQNGVNVVIAGHVHAYERTNKIYKNTVDETNGVYYVTTGSGGNYEGHAGPRLSDSLIPDWSLAANNVTFGGSRVIATRDSLRYMWFANDFLSDTEAVATDGFTINANGADVIEWPQNSTTSAPTATLTATPSTTTSTPSTTTATPSTTTSTPSTTTSTPSTTTSTPSTTTATPSTTETPEPTVPRGAC